MDYNYSNQQGKLYKKKLDVKGLVLTIVCLIMSVITALSTLMPLIKVEYEWKSSRETLNLIDICKLVGSLAELDTNRYDSGSATVFGLLLVATMLPIIITVLSTVYAIIYVVRLAALKYVQKASGFAKIILTLEILFSMFSMIIVFYAMDERFISDDEVMGAGITIGWYLPVVLAAIIILVEYICNMTGMLKNSSEKSKDLATTILGFVGIIVSLTMYIAFAASQCTLYEDGYSLGVSPAYLLWYAAGEIFNMLIGRNTTIIYTLIMLFAITVTILARIGISKNLKITKKKKYGAVFSIVTGILAVVLAIVNYVLCSIRFDSYDEVKFGLGTYIYIISGSILIILGIASLCIKNCWNNREDMLPNGQYDNQVQYQNQLQYQNQMQYQDAMQYQNQVQYQDTMQNQSQSQYENAVSNQYDAYNQYVAQYYQNAQNSEYGQQDNTQQL